MNSDLQIRQLSLTNMLETATIIDNKPQVMKANLYYNPQRRIIDIRKQFKTTLPFKAGNLGIRTDIDVQTTRITTNDCIDNQKPIKVEQVLSVGQVGCCCCTLPCAMMEELCQSLKVVGLVVINAFRDNQ